MITWLSSKRVGLQPEHLRPARWSDAHQGAAHVVVCADDLQAKAPPTRLSLFPAAVPYIFSLPPPPFPTPSPLPPPPCHSRVGQVASLGGSAALSVWDFGTKPQSKPDQDFVHFGLKSGTSFGIVFWHHKRPRLSTCSGRHPTGRSHNGTTTRTWFWCLKMDLFLERKADQE